MNHNHKSFAERMAQAKIAKASGGHSGGNAAKARKRPLESANDNCAWILDWRRHWQSQCAEIRNEFSRVALSNPHETWEF